MDRLMTGRQMKEIDFCSIEELGIPSVVLMERAALETALCAEETGSYRQPVQAVCGLGNNGADGIAAARILFLRGRKVEIYLPGKSEQGTGEWELQLRIARNIGMTVKTFSEFSPRPHGVILDALFGVGLSREIEGVYADVIDRMNESSCSVISVDMPSGVHADTGITLGKAVRADITVTFGFAKPGLFLNSGKELSGAVKVADIGFPGPEILADRPILRQHYVFTCGREDLKEIPGRPSRSNKGSFGKILIAAGSENMSGAAYLSALAAYRMGAGLVRILTPSSNRVILQTLLPEAVIVSYDPDEAKKMSPGFAEELRQQCAWADVAVAGPGLTTREYAIQMLLALLSEYQGPLVVDADGLNIIADYPELARYYTENTIITPHPGEMARLTGMPVKEIKKDPVKAAADYAGRHGITCVLKDHVTVSSWKGQKNYINTSGASALAKAGTGDVLTGVIAGLIAIGMDCAEAAVTGALVHGLAGEKAAGEKGEHGVLAREVAEMAAEIVRFKCGEET